MLHLACTPPTSLIQWGVTGKPKIQNESWGVFRMPHSEESMEAWAPNSSKNIGIACTLFPDT